MASSVEQTSEIEKDPERHRFAQGAQISAGGRLTLATSAAAGQSMCPQGCGTGSG